MTSARDQVILLTKGVVLPERPLGRIHLTVIADAIRAAWELILAEWPDQAATGDERLVNAALVARLKIASTIPSPFMTLVSRIDRGTEDYSFNGTHIEKRPDINMVLTERLAGFPFVGECKIIDAPTRRTVAKYDADGMQRFVSGDYAWFNPQAVMVAYVRDGTDAAAALKGLTGVPAGSLPSRSGSHALTTHDRTFTYLDREPGEAAPGPIAIVHVWLDARSAHSAAGQGADEVHPACPRAGRLPRGPL